MSTALPKLIVITDWSAPDAQARIEALCTLGARVALQHRDPGSPIRSFLERARWMAEVCSRSGTPLFVNGRLEVALLVGAHLHLPEEAPSPQDVRPHLPRGRWISAAVHGDPDRAQGADLALVSPVFSPGSKKDRPSEKLLGLSGLADLAQRMLIPTYALGGITAQTAGTLPRGCGSAAISSVFSAQSPVQAAQAILNGLP